MTELRCEANEGLELITRSFWIERDSTAAKAVWMGLDDQEGPRISTTAKDGADVVDASSEDKRTDFDDAAELDSYLGDKLSQCEVVLEEPADVEQAWVFVTCSYQMNNSRTVIYAREVEGWDSRPSE